MAEDTNNWVEFEQDGYHIRALAPFKKFRGLEIPWNESEAVIDTATEALVKASRSRKVVKLSAGQYGLPVEVFVKRYNFRSWVRYLLRTGRKSRAREEFDLGWRLMKKGIRTPRPVWLAESTGAISKYSLLATEALPEAESALERYMRCESERQRRELLIALGQFTGRMHDCGFYHDDYKAAHLLIFPDRPSSARDFFLIDLLGGSFPPVLTRLHRAKNLYQMLRSFVPKRKSFGFTQEHRDIFLLAYSGNALQATEWGKWVERMGRFKGRKV
ncbi:MAG TPA: lipopolysaccharide kinase InaA family protein [Planctomycetota bacterium]|nr:lipopolysaccharide kinase InaA family protein [Planctomycetota bacterium]